MKPRLKVEARIYQDKPLKDYFRNGGPGISKSCMCRLLSGHPGEIWALHRCLDALNVPKDKRGELIEWVK